jgi:hypothetical protein
MDETRRKRRWLRCGLRTLSVVVGLVPALCTICAAEESRQVIPVKYSSPEAVFDAYREALGKRDWRTIYLCYTPDAQKSAIFETYFASQVHRRTKAIEGVLKKFLVDKSLDAPEPPNSSDHAKLVDYMYKSVSDPTGFFIEVNTVLREADQPLDPPGELHDVSVDGEVARGHANLTVRSIEFESGRPSKSFADKHDSTFRFCKRDGGWLIDVAR